VLKSCTIDPYWSNVLPISLSKNPSFSNNGPEEVIYSSSVRTRFAIDPSGRFPVAINLASGINKVRILSQFLFSPAPPDITSYNAATIPSIELTSLSIGATLSVLNPLAHVSVFAGDILVKIIQIRMQ